MAIVCSVWELSASPIDPSRPASRPAPKIMSTPMPLAVAVRKIEPSSESAATTTTASARRRPAPTGDCGHQSPAMPVITTAPA